MGAASEPPPAPAMIILGLSKPSHTPPTRSGVIPTNQTRRGRRRRVDDPPVRILDAGDESRLDDLAQIRERGVGGDEVQQVDRRRPEALDGNGATGASTP